MEVKYEIFYRVPPGDRWVEVNTDKPVYPSLTDALESYYQKTNCRQYFIDAAQGKIFRTVEEPDPVIPPKTYNIYGEY